MGIPRPENQRGTLRRPWVGVGVPALVLGMCLGTSPALGQTGTVEGTVTGVGGAAVARAQVAVEGTSVATVTGDDGRFVLVVPAGQRTLRVAAIGFKFASVRLTVTPGATVTTRVELTPSVLQLDEVVVTATGEQRKRELANAVTTIPQMAQVTEEAPIVSMSSLLTGRASGVQVSPGSGTTGAGSRIRIRGSASVSLNNAPLVYVDGARVGTSESALSINVGGQQTSRFDDLNPDDIESIEIIKGPSAATLYGTQAANGVIRIRTKRGRGATRLQLWGEGGMLKDENTYPAVYRAVTSTGSACPLTSVAAGLCQQAQLQTFNLLKDPSTTVFRTGNRFKAGGNISGSVTGVDYFLSGERETEDGVLQNNESEKVNLRGNFGFEPRSGLKVDVATGYLNSGLRLPNADNSSLGILAQGLLTSVPAPDGWWSFTPQQLYQLVTRQDVTRYTGSVNLSWQPLTWLSGRGSAGLDLANRFDSQFEPPGVINRGREILGVRVANRYNEAFYTAEFAATATAKLTERINAQTSVGVQYYQESRRGTTTRGEELAAGTNSVSGAAVTLAGEESYSSKTIGAFAQEQVGFNGRLFLTVAARGDDNSAFGSNFNFVTYPKLSGSWVISEEPFFPVGGLVSSLRLRLAWGQSGNQPGVRDALTFLRGVPSTTSDIANEIGVTFDGGGLGNAELKPERSSEIETGFDASLFSDRVSLEVTYYDKQTRDALVFRAVPPSVGTVAGRWENIGQVSNRGVEATLSAQPLSGDRLSLGVTVAASYNHNELVTLGEGIPPISVAGGGRHVEGYPLGGYWARPIDGYADANGDGIIAAGEIQVGADEVYIGAPSPTTQLSVQPQLGLWRYVTLSALLDYRGGYRLNNSTASFRCGRATDWARNDPSAPFEEQARCVASAFLQTAYGYVEDASFAKLREVSLTLNAPASVARAIRAGSLGLTLAARNLKTWTDYTGLDPELNRYGGDNFATAEFLTQPAPTYWTARLNIRF